MTVDAVLFDLGDTLFNYEGGLQLRRLFHAGARNAYDRLGTLNLDRPAYPAYVRRHLRAMRWNYFRARVTRRDFNAMHVMQRVLSTMGVATTPEHAEELAWAWYEPMMLETRLEPGVAEMLQSLEDAGVRMAIVSNTCVPGHCLDRHLESAGLLKYFPVRVYSCDVVYRKPHRRIFQIALERMRTATTRTVFIGDLLRADIRGARRAGMRTIWKPALYNEPSPNLRHGADAMVRSITQLPEALEGFGWSREREESALVA